MFRLGDLCQWSAFLIGAICLSGEVVRLCARLLSSYLFGSRGRHSILFQVEWDGHAPQLLLQGLEKRGARAKIRYAGVNLSSSSARRACGEGPAVAILS